jgi:hypothetical protein
LVKRMRSDKRFVDVSVHVNKLCQSMNSEVAWTVDSNKSLSKTIALIDNVNIDSQQGFLTCWTFLYLLKIDGLGKSFYKKIPSSSNIKGALK